VAILLAIIGIAIALIYFIYKKPGENGNGNGGGGPVIPCAAGEDYMYLERLTPGDILTEFWDQRDQKIIRGVFAENMMVTFLNSWLATDHINSIQYDCGISQLAVI